MNKEFSFSIHSLLTDTNGTIKGPISPVAFAQDMCKQMNETYNRIARVRFTDNETLQQYDEDGISGYDILLIGDQYDNDLFLGLWVDTGAGGLPVAMCCQSDREMVITPIYERQQFARKLSRKEIQQVFEHVFCNPNSISVKPVKQ